MSPGIEKTFLDGNASVELRVPFASTLDSAITAGGTTGRNTELVGAVSADRIVPDRAACIRGADRNIWSRRVVDT